jgi:hypothetical protein
MKFLKNNCHLETNKTQLFPEWVWYLTLSTSIQFFNHFTFRTTWAKGKVYPWRIRAPHVYTVRDTQVWVKPFVQRMVAWSCTKMPFSCIRQTRTLSYFLVQCTLYITKSAEYYSVRHKQRLLDAKHCAVHRWCTYDTNKTSEVNATFAHHTVTKQCIFSVPLFSISFSACDFLRLLFYFVFFSLSILHILSLVGFNSFPKLQRHSQSCWAHWTNQKWSIGDCVSRLFKVIIP